MSKTAIILAGGQSSRMGVDKALMRFGDGLLRDRVLDVLRPHFDDLILVTNQPERHFDLEDVRLVTDVAPGQGPLGGIYAGLLAAQGRHALVVGCDMPFLSAPLLDYLWGLRTWGEVVVPLTPDALAPICAVYDRAVLPAIHDALAAGERKVMGLYPRLEVHYVREDELRPYDPELMSLANLNTPEDFEQALAALALAER
jgi:molybdopterin-guanine dinucleotide biosynthesis protein A